MASTLYNSSKPDFYNECMGRQEQFLYSVPNFFKEKTYQANRINLPLLSPYRLFINIKMLAFVVIIPVLYALIYKFRRNHDMQITGKKDNITFVRDPSKPFSHIETFLGTWFLGSLFFYDRNYPTASLIC